jgi:flagellar motility protein MotE (MotC chaperone)
MARKTLMKIIRKNLFYLILLITIFVSIASSLNAEISTNSSKGKEDIQGNKPQLPKNISATNPETLRLLEIIERKNKDLERREAELLTKEENLKTLELKIRQDLQTIEKAMVRSEELAGARKGMIEENITSLARVYSSMKPAQAAAILDRVDESIAIQILSRMRSRNSAKILGKMNTSVARNISERIAGKFNDNEITTKN